MIWETMKRVFAVLASASVAMLGLTGTAAAQVPCGAGHLCLYRDIDLQPHPGSHWLSNGNLDDCVPIDVRDGVWSSATNNSRFIVELWNNTGSGSKRLVATLRPGQSIKYFGSAGNDRVDRVWNLSCA
jgi:hypothetical protein